MAAMAARLQRISMCGQYPIIYGLRRPLRVVDGPLLQLSSMLSPLICSQPQNELLCIDSRRTMLEANVAALQNNTPSAAVLLCCTAARLPASIFE